jgi:hypothetical protein
MDGGRHHDEPAEVRPVETGNGPVEPQDQGREVGGGHDGDVQDDQGDVPANQGHDPAGPTDRGRGLVGGLGRQGKALLTLGGWVFRQGSECR